MFDGGLAMGRGESFGLFFSPGGYSDSVLRCSGKH